MSTKEAALAVISRLADSVTLPEIVAALDELRAETCPAAETEEYSSEELPHEEWMAVVAHSLAGELSDPCQDIYTLEDGEPIDEAR